MGFFGTRTKAIYEEGFTGNYIEVEGFGVAPAHHQRHYVANIVVTHEELKSSYRCEKQSVGQGFAGDRRSRQGRRLGC